jgi:hypothetical protein
LLPTKILRLYFPLSPFISGDKLGHSFILVLTHKVVAQRWSNISRRSSSGLVEDSTRVLEAFIRMSDIIEDCID